MSHRCVANQRGDGELLLPTVGLWDADVAVAGCVGQGGQSNGISVVAHARTGQVHAGAATCEQQCNALRPDPHVFLVPALGLNNFVDRCSHGGILRASIVRLLPARPLTAECERGSASLICPAALAEKHYAPGRASKPAQLVVVHEQAAVSQLLVRSQCTQSLGIGGRQECAGMGDLLAALERLVQLLFQRVLVL
eukprot:5955181-Prymnesium_polylepis.2